MKNNHFGLIRYCLVLSMISISTLLTQVKAQCPNPTSIWLSAAQTNTTFPLQWTSAAGAQSYDLRYCELPNTNNDTTVIKGFSTTTTQTLIGLRKNVNHKLQIRSVCSGVPATSWFNAASNYLTANNAGTCTALSTISATVTGGNNILVTWSGSGSYTVRYRATSTSDWIIPNVSGMNVANGSTGYTISSLANGTYTVGVKVNCSGQSSTYTTTTVTIGAGCTGTPTAPSAPAVSGITATSVNVTTPSTPAGLTYNLRYALQSAPTTYTSVSSLASGIVHTVNGLTASTAYNIQIQAQCNANVSTWSAITPFTTLASGNDLWREPHKNITIANQPATTAMQFRHLFGTNIGYGIWDIPLQYKGVLNHVRNFNLMENDYAAPIPGASGSAKFGKHLPNEGAPNPNLNPSTNYFANMANCNELLTPANGKNGFFSKDWYGKWRTNTGFDTTFAAIEAIFPKNSSFPVCDSFDIARGYPDKFYTPSELGSSSTDIRNKIAAYTKSFVQTYCPSDLSKPCLVNTFEIGNEPWGIIAPTKNGYIDIVHGVIQGMKEAYNTPTATNASAWRMKLSTAAFEAYTSAPGCFNNDINQYIEEMIPVSARPFIDNISIHNYASPYADTYNGGITGCAITKSPEANDGAFLTLKNMVAWKNTNMPHARINITEFGWHDNNGVGTQVGSVGQNAYYMRALLLSHRFNIAKTFLYTLFDSPAEPNFFTTSFFTGQNFSTPRNSFLALKKVVDKSVSIKDKRFLKAISENNNPTTGYIAYIYGTASGQPTDLIVWRAQEFTTQQNTFITPSTTATVISLPTGLSVNSGSSFYYLNHDATNDGLVVNGTTGNVYISGSNAATVNVKVSGMPIVIPLATNSCSYNSSGTLSCGCSITNAGSFSGDECFASSYNPALINMPAATGNPTISYLWEQSTNGTSWTNAASPNTTLTYDPSTISVTTWYRRKATSSACPTNFQYSNLVKKQVGGCSATTDLSITFLSHCKMANGNVKMQLEAKNLGTSALSNIVVNFNSVLSTGYNPSGTVYSPSGSSTYVAGWTGGPNSVWNIPTLAVGATVTLLFEHYLQTTTPGVTVQATHSYAGDNVPANNTTSISTFPINNCANPSGTAGRPASTLLDDEVIVDVYPNPFANTLNFDVTVPKGDVCKIELYSLNGQSIYQTDYNLSKGVNKVEINSTNFLPGVYTLKLSLKEYDSVIKKVIKIE